MTAPAPRSLRPVLARLLIGLLVVVLGLALYFSLNPAGLYALLRFAPIPGSVPIPTPGPTPPLPVISASPGPLPAGYQAYTGASPLQLRHTQGTPLGRGRPGGQISCGFLLDLGDGRRVGITAAHASPHLAPGVPAGFYDPDGARVAVLSGQIARGQTFIGDQLSMDYVLWAVDPQADPARFLLPDPRPLAQPGEPVYLYAPAADGAGGPLRWPGVVVSAAPNVVWVQLEDSFSPAGYSGCPVVSRVTGRLLGMALAGADLPLESEGSVVVIGLHPAASLVEKAQAAVP